MIIDNAFIKENGILLEKKFSKEDFTYNQNFLFLDCVNSMLETYNQMKGNQQHKISFDLKTDDKNIIVEMNAIKYESNNWSYPNSDMIEITTIGDKEKKYISNSYNTTNTTTVQGIVSMTISKMYENNLGKPVEDLKAKTLNKVITIFMPSNIQEVEIKKEIEYSERNKITELDID